MPFLGSTSGLYVILVPSEEYKNLQDRALSPKLLGSRENGLTGALSAFGTWTQLGAFLWNTAKAKMLT